MLTFFGPFVATANPYFATWAALLCSLLLLTSTKQVPLTLNLTLTSTSTLTLTLALALNLTLALTLTLSSSAVRSSECLAHRVPRRCWGYLHARRCLSSRASIFCRR